MATTTKAITLAVSSAFAFSIAATTVNAAANPFTAKSLSSGYMVAEADTKMKDGKCSANKKKSEAAAAAATSEKPAEAMPMEKSAEGSCKAGMKMQDGSCHADKAK